MRNCGKPCGIMNLSAARGKQKYLAVRTISSLLIILFRNYALRITNYELSEP